MNVWLDFFLKYNVTSFSTSIASRRLMLISIFSLLNRAIYLRKTRSILKTSSWSISDDFQYRERISVLVIAWQYAEESFTHHMKLVYDDCTKILCFSISSLISIMIELHKTLSVYLLQNFVKKNMNNMRSCNSTKHDVHQFRSEQAIVLKDDLIRHRFDEIYAILGFR